MPEGEAKRRVFVALPVPSWWQEEYAAFCAANPGLAKHLPHFHWTPAANLHLTAFFIGEVQADKLPAIEDALARVAAGVRPFELRPEVVTYAPPGKPRARMIWGHDPANADFLALARRLEQALTKARPKPPPREPAAHITLARFEPRPWAKLPELNVADWAGTFPAKAIELWESVRGGGASPYRHLKRFPLGQSAEEDDDDA